VVQLGLLGLGILSAGNVPVPLPMKIEKIYSGIYFVSVFNGIKNVLEE
jgi:hypothetical protein